MHAIEEICTITAKGQTTVPKAVRQALGVGYGGRIAFRVADGGAVTIHALADDSETDPALAPFLDLLAADLRSRPAEAVWPIAPALATRLEEIAVAVRALDIDAPIEGTVTL